MEAAKHVDVLVVQRAIPSDKAAFRQWLNDELEQLQTEHAGRDGIARPVVLILLLR